MVKSLIYVLFLWVFTNTLNFAKAQELSLSSKVSVLTFGPGRNLNDAFGHNAFRIKDSVLGIDEVYGYGEYDFEAPNFYLKFASGKLNYLISKYNYNIIEYFYKLNNRSIYEQVLNFSLKEKQQLYNILSKNYLPENRAYKYDFFFDNCATRIRDVSQKASINSIKFKKTNLTNNKTFRQLIHEHVALNSWGGFGIDVALGALVDNKATANQYMFLPKYIHHSFNFATINHNKPLVSSNKTIFRASKLKKSWSSFFWSPLFILIIISTAIIYFTYKDYKSNIRTKWIDTCLFTLTGLAGVILTLLWFATDHTATMYNYNLLWAFPFNLLVVVPLLRKEQKKWIKAYVKFLLLSLCLMLFHTLTGVQVFSIVLIPLCVALSFRYLYLVKVLQN